MIHSVQASQEVPIEIFMLHINQLFSSRPDFPVYCDLLTLQENQTSVTPHCTLQFPGIKYNQFFDDDSKEAIGFVKFFLAKLILFCVINRFLTPLSQERFN